MKHYGHFLPFAGRIVKYRLEDIDRLLAKQRELQTKLETISTELEDLEKEFYEFIKDDWSNEEIEQAKEQSALS